MLNKIINPNDGFGLKFYRLPVVLLENNLYKDIKVRSKLAYALLQDRLDISKKNGFVEKNGDVYFYFSNPGLEEYC